jgi:hypothetical protein
MLAAVLKSKVCTAPVRSIIPLQKIAILVQLHMVALADHRTVVSMSFPCLMLQQQAGCDQRELAMRIYRAPSCSAAAPSATVQSAAGGVTVLQRQLLQAVAVCVGARVGLPVEALVHLVGVHCGAGQRSHRRR